jgi:hypothetical protein
MKKARVTWLAFCCEHGIDSSCFILAKESLIFWATVKVTKKILLQGIKQVDDIHWNWIMQLVQKYLFIILTYKNSNSLKLAYSYYTH